MRRTAWSGPNGSCWHRAYLLEFERLLARKRPGITVPYWDWLRGGVPSWLRGWEPAVTMPSGRQVEIERGRRGNTSTLAKVRG